MTLLLQAEMFPVKDDLPGALQIPGRGRSSNGLWILPQKRFRASPFRHSGVTIDHICDGRISVVSNNIQGMEELVTYIYKKGHRKIAYIHGDDTSVTKNRLGSLPDPAKAGY